jgi:hypothetical protein
MLTRLRQPGGPLGILSVVATLVLAIAGVFGIVSTLIPAWEDDLDLTQSDKALLYVLCALMIVGAVGFLIMDRQPWLGAALAILGSIALAISLFWTIVPIVLGVTFIIVAVRRAMAFGSHAAHA